MKITRLAVAAVTTAVLMSLAAPALASDGAERWLSRFMRANHSHDTWYGDIKGYSHRGATMVVSTYLYPKAHSRRMGRAACRAASQAGLDALGIKRIVVKGQGTTLARCRSH
jgi:hypothetical protein